VLVAAKVSFRAAKWADEGLLRVSNAGCANGSYRAVKLAAEGAAAGHSLQGQTSGKSGHVRYAAEGGSRFRAINGFAASYCGLMVLPWT
jgi:hypothetical protein